MFSKMIFALLVFLPAGAAFADGDCADPSNALAVAHAVALAAHAAAPQLQIAGDGYFYSKVGKDLVLASVTDGKADYAVGLVKCEFTAAGVPAFTVLSVHYRSTHFYGAQDWPVAAVDGDAAAKKDVPANGEGLDASVVSVSAGEGGRSSAQ